MNQQPMRTWLILAATLLFGLTGCTNDPAPGAPGGGGGRDADVSCTSAGPGCECDPGAAPIPCYLDAEPTAGGLTCHAGSLYCRGGVWSSCEDVSSYFMEIPADALITAPSECNPCDPDCFIGSDTPDDTDLDPTNSSGIEYDPGVGGITLNGCGTPPGAIVRYHFDSSTDSATTIVDRAPTTPVVNMTSGGVDSTAVTFSTGAYGGQAYVNGATLEATAADSDLLGNALIASNAFTVEVWASTTIPGQNGPKRIVTYSNGASERAFTIGQDGNKVIVRLRTTATNANGDAFLDTTNSVLEYAGLFSSSTPKHIVFTWDGSTGDASLYVNGVLRDQLNHGSGIDLSNWTLNDTFGYGDEFGAARTWNGTLYHSAIYAVAMDATQIACRYDGGPDPIELSDDTDGDGVADTADDCDGPGWASPCDGDPTNDGLFHSLSYGGPAEIDPVDVNTTLQTADVYILMDGTGSMDGEISNLKTDLTTGSFGCATSGGIIGAISCTFPEAWFGVGYFVEYPDGVAGDEDSLPYHHMLDITDDISAVTEAVNSLTTNGNIDTPEAQTQALYSVASGMGLGAYVPNRGPCTNATDFGYPCFRFGTIPIVIMFTDAPFHNGPSGSYLYTSSSASSLMAEAVAALGNDTFGTAYDIGDVTGTAVTVMSTTFAQTDAVSSMGCNSNSQDTVFQFNITTAGTVKLSTRMSEYDSVVGLYDAIPSVLACNDNWTGTPSPTHPYLRSAELSQYLTAGTYYAVVDGDSDKGAAQLLVDNSDGTTGSMTTAAPVSYADTLAALAANEIHVITVMSGTGAALTDAQDLGTDTNSVDDLGNPYVETIASDGSGLSTAVSDAVYNLANSTRFDITLTAEDNIATIVDETCFVDAITVNSCPSTRCDPGLSGNTCQGCIPATDVGFSVSFQNDCVMPTTTDQIFEFDLVMYANGSIELARKTVRIVVPADVPSYPTTGYYQQVYDATTVCNVPTTRPDWGDFTWTNDTGTGATSDSSITYQFKTANTLADLGTAVTVSFTDPTSIPSGPPFDMGDWLVANGESNYLPFLQVTAILTSSSDTFTSPVLYGFQQQFTCVPAE